MQVELLGLHWPAHGKEETLLILPVWFSGQEGEVGLEVGEGVES